jgi:phosphoglycolate phosphatase
MISYVVFDFDGTLVDSNEIKTQAFFDVTSGIPNANKILTSILKIQDFGDRYKIFDYLCRELKSNNDNLRFNSKLLVEKYTNLCERKILEAPYIFGTQETLDQLYKLNFKLFISSATPQKELIKIVKQKKIHNYFEKIYGSPQSKFQHIINIIMDRNCDPSEILYLGDSEVDRTTSLMSNCHFIGVGSDSSRFDVRPKILIDSLIGLPQIIDNI